MGSHFIPNQAPPANSPPTYHTDEVDAQEDLAGGLEGTAAGFPTVELPSTTSQHKKSTNDGNCARVHTDLSQGKGTPVRNCSCHISPDCPEHRTVLSMHPLPFDELSYHFQVWWAGTAEIDNSFYQKWPKGVNKIVQDPTESKWQNPDTKGCLLPTPRPAD